MLRKVYMNFYHRLTLMPHQELLKCIRPYIKYNRICQRFLCTSLNSCQMDYIKENEDDYINESEQLHNYLGIDTDLREPYVERTRTNIKNLQTALKDVYRMNSKEIDNILNNKWVPTYTKLRCLIFTLEELKRNGIKKQSLLDYPWLLALDSVRLKDKFEVLSTLNGIKNLNEFTAFLRIQLPRLRGLISTMNNEAPYILYGNRAYYIARKLNVEPYVANKYLAKRLFVLEMPWEMFNKNLEYMIAYNVSPFNILKDLWSFRYKPNVVEKRLKLVQKAKKDKIMPWMIRCSEVTLQKTLQLSLEEQKILGGKATIVEYLAERLGFTLAETQSIINRCTQVYASRAPKIKEMLDYLLDEEGFTKMDIAQTPRVLIHSLETVKQRLRELKKYNCRPNSLIVVCRSKKQYAAFLNKWLQYCKNVNNETEQTANINKIESKT